MFQPPAGQSHCSAVDKRDKGYGDEPSRNPIPKYMITSIMRAKSQFD